MTIYALFLLELKRTNDAEIIMSAKILKFPFDQKHRIATMLKRARSIESDLPEECIRIQRRVIVMLALECKRAERAAAIIKGSDI